MRNLALIPIFTALAAAGCAGGAPESTPPNLLLITLDTVRADRIGAYGYAGAQTPAIDQLAAEGIRFERAIAPTPTTLPSHATLFTGLAPPSHGVRDNAANGLADSASTLAEAFRAAGYATGAFVGAYVLDAGRGLAQGFDVYDGVDTGGAAPTSLAQAERRGDLVVEAALPWIGAQEGPWFAWIHLFDAHAPYAAPEPFGSRAPDPYDGEIVWLDAIVGGLRNQLQGMDAWTDTTVILTADHGESLGEHGELTHGFFIYDATIRVPLIVRPADSVFPAADGPPTRGAVVPTPVGLIDLFPTIAELFDLAAPENLQGRSLVTALDGAMLAPTPIYSETLYPLLQFGWHDLRAITVGDDKLIEAPTTELYDLATDPGEIDNIAAGSDRVIERLRGDLAPWIAPDLEGDAAAGLTTDPDELAALRALGYVAVARAASGGEELADPKDKIDTFRQITEAMGAWRAGAPEAALTSIDALIAAEPDFAGAHHFRGLVLSGSDDAEGAIAAFERALEIDPDHQVAGRALVRAQLSLGRVEPAEAVLTDLLSASPADAELRWELHRVYLQQNKVGEAVALIDEGLAIDPEAARLHLAAGLIALQLQDPATALAALERAAGLEPNLFAAHFNRALALSALGRTDEIIEPLEAALRARPRAPQALLFLAQALFDGGDPGQLDRARRLAEDGISRTANPQLLALGHATLAEIYAAQGRDEDAAEQREAAARAGRGR